MRIETLKDDYLDLTDLLEPEGWDIDLATFLVPPIIGQIVDASRAKPPDKQHSPKQF